jgi:hypothetical protein
LREGLGGGGVGGARALVDEGGDGAGDRGAEAVGALGVEIDLDRAAERREALVGLGGGEADAERLDALLGRARAEAAVDGRGAGGDEVRAEVDEALGDGDRGRGDEGVEGLFGGLGLGLGGGAHAPDHGCGDAWIAEEEGAAEELDHAGDGALGVRRDGGDEGGGAAAPLGGGERRIEEVLHLLADLRHHGGEEAARDGDVAPHEVLAVGEEAVPRARDGVGEEIEVAAVRGGAGDVAEEAEAARIALLRAAGDLAGAALQHAGGEAALGERACGGGADPCAREVAARREGEREGVGGHVGPPREVDAHGDAGAGAAACEGARRGGGHARGDGDEGARVALEELREHAAPEIAALGAERERRRELVEADARGLGREEIEVVEEAVLARCDHGMEEALGVEAVERTGRVRLRGERELREALAEDRLPHAPIAPRREVDEPGGDVRARCHLGPRGGGAFRDIADGARNLAGPGAPYEEREAAPSEEGVRPPRLRRSRTATGPTIALAAQWHLGQFPAACPRLGPSARASTRFHAGFARVTSATMSCARRSPRGPRPSPTWCGSRASGRATRGAICGS